MEEHAEALKMRQVVETFLRERSPCLTFERTPFSDMVITQLKALLSVQNPPICTIASSPTHHTLTEKTPDTLATLMTKMQL